MPAYQRRSGGRPARNKRPAVLLFTAAVLVSGTGCESLLEVELPGQVVDQELNNPALAQTMVVSALGEFECALNQFVATNAFLTGEFISSNFFLSSNVWGWRGDVEIRATEGACPSSRETTNYGYYTPLHRARFLAEDGAARIEQFSEADVPNRTSHLATLAAYAGYAYTYLGESFCEMAVDGGPPMTPAEVLAVAEQRFTEALELAQQAGNNDIRNMALVGRARVRLDLGKLAQAAADAEQVEEGYVRNAEYSTIEPRRENTIYNRTSTAYMSVGFDWRDLTVDGAPDPRVPVTFTGEVGQDGTTPQWDQLKYTSAADPIPIATWREAQLILAEARGGTEAIDAINRVRATHDIPPLDPSEVDDIQAAVLEERRREFFLEGHRHSDMIRHDIPFPSGVNHKGHTFQPYSCMPLPDVERNNNPHFSG